MITQIPRDRQVENIGVQNVPIVRMPTPTTGPRIGDIVTVVEDGRPTEIWTCIERVTTFAGLL